MSSPRTHNHVHLWPDACTHISRHLSLLYFGSLSSGPHYTKTNSHIRAIVIVIVLKMLTLNAVFTVFVMFVVQLRFSQLALSI